MIAPSGGDRGDLAGQDLVVVDARHRHLAGPAFGIAELVGDRLAAGDQVSSRRALRLAGEFVFAGLEAAARAGDIGQPPRTRRASLMMPCFFEPAAISGVPRPLLDLEDLACRRAGPAGVYSLIADRSQRRRRRSAASSEQQEQRQQRRARSPTAAACGGCGSGTRSGSLRLAQRCHVLPMGQAAIAAHDQ